MKIVWATLGILSIGLAVIGAFLPLLPTVPLLLLASFCFARSSSRMLNWMLSHPTFGPVIDDWNSSGAIGPRAKRLATLSIAFVFLLSVILAVPTKFIVFQALVLSAVLTFIWTRPNA